MIYPNELFNKTTYEIDISLIKQNFKPPFEYKEKYGEVNTPFYLIEDMLYLFPNECFTKPTHRWLDPACGYGYFTIILYNRLMDGLKEIIKFPSERSRHILENMIYMCELNEKHINELTGIFHVENIISGDFLSTSLEDWREKIRKNNVEDNFNGFDYIIGNPPYNSNGFKKVPTNSRQDKKKDGKTIWMDFVKHSISFLKPNGFLSMITPSIWMKPDKAKMYNYMLQYKIYKLRCFTNTETSNIFKKQAQTPTCYYLLENKYNQPDKGIYIWLYDTINKNKYTNYNIKIGSAIPLQGCSIIYKLQTFMEKHNIPPLKIYKTNMVSVNTTLQDTKTNIHKYPNIKTCVIIKNKIGNQGLEKYAFEFIPDITKMSKYVCLNPVPKQNNYIYETSLYNLFGFTRIEIEYIEKQYGFYE